MSEDKSTLARCVALLEAQGEDLREIKADVKAQNGRVSTLEKDAIRIKAYWTAGVLIFGFFADWIRHKIGIS